MLKLKRLIIFSETLNINYDQVKELGWLVKKREKKSRILTEQFSSRQ